MILLVSCRPPLRNNQERGDIQALFLFYDTVGNLIYFRTKGTVSSRIKSGRIIRPPFRQANYVFGSFFLVGWTQPKSRKFCLGRHVSQFPRLASFPA